MVLLFIFSNHLLLLSQKMSTNIRKINTYFDYFHTSFENEYQFYIYSYYEFIHFPGLSCNFWLCYDIRNLAPRYTIFDLGYLAQKVLS